MPDHSPEVIAAAQALYRAQAAAGEEWPVSVGKSNALLAIATKTANGPVRAGVYDRGRRVVAGSYGPSYTAACLALLRELGVEPEPAACSKCAEADRDREWARMARRVAEADRLDALNERNEARRERDAAAMDDVARLRGETNGAQEIPDALVAALEWLANDDCTLPISEMEALVAEVSRLRAERDAARAELAALRARMRGAVTAILAGADLHREQAGKDPASTLHASHHAAATAADDCADFIERCVGEAVVEEPTKETT